MIVAGAAEVKTPMSQSTLCSVAIAFMLCCAVDTVRGGALAGSPQLVEFEGASRPGGLQQRLARERGEAPKDIPGDRLRGFLTKPVGDGPFPAIVALHGCSGLPEEVVRSASERAISSG